MRKQKGESHYIAFGVVLFAIIALWVCTLDWSGAQVKSGKIVDVMRKYLLVMEGNGCLTVSEQQAMTLELEKLGVKMVTFNTNPLVKVAYGEEVILSVSGEVDALKITSMDGFSIIRTGEGVRFTKTLTSTAQY